LRAVVHAVLLAGPQPHRGGLQQGEGAPQEGRGAHARGPLVEAMGEALWAVKPRDAEGWFAHCGYGSTGQYS
jgi:hypothetical protein